MLDSDLGIDIGTRITLDKVTLVGSTDFTLMGRPVLPRDLVRVEATVVEKNLSKTEVGTQCKQLIVVYAIATFSASLIIALACRLPAFIKVFNASRVA